MDNSTSSSDTKLPNDQALDENQDTGNEGVEGQTEGLQSDESQTKALPKSEVPKWQRKLDEERKARLAAEEEAKTLREAERQRKLADMTETERLQTQLAEETAEKYKLKIQTFVTAELNRRGLSLSNPHVEMVYETPWAVPVVKRVLGDSPSWEEVDKAVREQLPSYLDSLVTSKSSNGETRRTSTETNSEDSESEEETGGSVDTERAVSSSGKRIWSRKEIAALSPSDYAKRKSEIDLAVSEGRIVS